jgi:pimeloyl-ACP methyl ester carboxylesterase
MFNKITLYALLQVDLLISFCSDMGLRSVVLVGHDDGGLLALRTAEKLRASRDSRKVAALSYFFCIVNFDDISY